MQWKHFQGSKTSHTGNGNAHEISAADDRKREDQLVYNHGVLSAAYRIRKKVVCSYLISERGMRIVKGQLLCGRDFGNSYPMKINLTENMPAGLVIIRDGENIREGIEKQPEEG